MKLPNGTQAIVDIEKLRDYCLNFEHPRGRHKARQFLAVLGLTRDQAPRLRAELLKQAAASEASVQGKKDHFGTRYVLEFTYQGLQRSARIRSGWIIRAGETVPRLTTCFIVEEVFHASTD